MDPGRGKGLGTMDGSVYKVCMVLNGKMNEVWRFTDANLPYVTVQVVSPALLI